MGATTLKLLGQNVADFKSENRQRDPAAKSGVFLFFSFDLSDSTAFKTEHPSLWSNVFTNFYSQILMQFGVENYKSQDSEYDDSSCIRKLWKLIGDEVLLYVEIHDLKQLYAQVSSVYNALRTLLDKIADKVAAELSPSHCATACLSHCQDIRHVITSTLGIKTTVWIAQCSEGSDKRSNIIYYPITPESNLERVDFLGRDIDEGFRLAKYAAKNKLILSPLLGWLIWKGAQSDPDKEKIVNSNFKITAFAPMKGVWRNRNVPIVMFHQSFETFDEILEYDELNLDTYQNIKEAGFDSFLTDKRFEIKRLDSILRNVHRYDEAEQIYQFLNTPRVDTVQATLISPIQEIHIACIAFSSDGKILVHSDSEHGYGFGSVKNRYGFEESSWKRVCEQGYYNKYKIKLSIPELPIPVATYHYDKKALGGSIHAFGLIIIGEFDESENTSEFPDDWGLYTFEEISVKTKNALSVNRFSENLNHAIELRNLMISKGEALNDP